MQTFFATDICTILYGLRAQRLKNKQYISKMLQKVHAKLSTHRLECSSVFGHFGMSSCLSSGSRFSGNYN